MIYNKEKKEIYKRIVGFMMEQKKRDAGLNANFGIIQGFYWSAFCSCNSFASVFLLSKDFDNRQVGIVLALANIFAVLLQPVVAAYADRTRRVTLKQIVRVLCFMTLCFAGVLLIIPKVFFLIAILFVLIVTGVLVIQPLINSLVFEFVNKGFDVNFGITRGIGSVAYALVSYALGVLIERKGPEMIPRVLFILLLGLTISILFIGISMKKEEIQKKETIYKKETIQKTGVQKAASNVSTLTFMKENRRFFGYLCGMVFLFAYHTMFNNYLVHIVKHVGGNSAQMGTAIFIAAVLELPVMGLFARMLKKTGIRTLLFSSAIFFFIKALGALFATNMLMLYFNQMLQIFAYAIMLPASVYYVNLIMKEKDRVKGQAYTTGAMTAGGVIGNLVGGVLIDEIGVIAMLIAAVIFTGIGMTFIFLFAEKWDKGALKRTDRS